MPSPTIEVKRNDLTATQVQLQDRSSSPTQPLDLSGVDSVWFHAVHRTGSKELHIECVIDEVAEALVSIPWADGDLDTEGAYNCEFEALWKSGATVIDRKTVPSGSVHSPSGPYKTLLVHADLGQAV